MKHYFSLLAFVLLSTSLFAYDFEVDGIYYNYLTGDSVEVTFGSSTYTGDITIPETVSFNNTLYHVTTIGTAAFMHCSGLTDITIPNTITSFGERAFMHCSSLTSISIPNNITTIDSFAFYGCTSLTSITIPNSVTNIGTQAFYNCSSLEEIISLPLTPPTIRDEYTFPFDIGPTIYVLPDAENAYLVHSIWGNFFIQQVAQPKNDGIYYKFLGGDSIEVISGASKYTGAITIPETVSFYNTLYRVTSIGKSAFSDCSNLTSITIPNSVISIGKNAFNGCTGLTSITLPNSIDTISSSIFQNCSSLTTITIPNSVTTIDYGAFNGCTGLTSITIPNSVTTIGDAAFKGCSNNLASITVIAGNAKYYSEGNCLIENATNTLILGCKNSTIPNSVTTIGTQAFLGCSNLTTITIPNSVTTIDSYAFYGCTSLTSITIPNSVTNIGTQAFYNCSSLEEIISLPLTPPTITEHSFDSNAPIYVLPNAINVYKNNSIWNTFNIQAFEKIEVDGIYYKFLGGDSIEVISGASKYTGAITIPETVSFNNTLYHVTTIGNTAFYGCTGLTSITIPNSVTSIGKSAFFDCSNLTSITIPNSVTSIGECAFYSCTGLTSITIPNNVNDISSSAFLGCSNNLASITVIAGNAKYYSEGNCLIENATNTLILGCKNSTIPNSVTTIGTVAFMGCSGLTSITIPNSVTSIGERAFSGCTGLTSITIPNGVTNIGTRAFYNCSSLEEIISLPLTPPTIIDEYTFPFDIIPTIYVRPDAENAYLDHPIWGHFYIQPSLDLEKIVIDGIGYKSLGGDSVKVTSGLSEYSGAITIPETISFNDTLYRVTSLGDSAFFNCTSLTSITIPNSVTTIGYGAFNGCSSLTTITIPNSVISIGKNAFNGCTGLTSITLPNSVTNIGEGAFSGCSGLTSITLPNSIDTISSSIFQNCSSLTTITIPNSVTNIGGGAFSGCSGLTSISIPNGVTTIGSSAFRGCTGLTSITIPNSVTSIGESAFRSCASLTSVVWNAKNCRDIPVELLRLFDSEITSFTFGDSVQHIPAYLCYGMNQLTSITLPNSIITIGEYAFHECSGLTSISIPNGVTTIGSSAFRGCTGLTSITLPNSIDTIDNFIFEKCSSLTSITIPNGVTTIGDNTFSGCSGLTSITIPNGVTTIGDNTFSGCSGLTSITIPNSVTNIGKGAFSGCSNLQYNTYDNAKYLGNSENLYHALISATTSSITSCTILENTKIIAGGAFSGCKSLTEVTIPYNVTNIGNGVFGYVENKFTHCKSLNKITFLATTPPNIGENIFLWYSGIIVIPCGTLNLYKNATYWENYTNYQELMDYTFSATPSNHSQGYISIFQEPTCQNDVVAIIEAQPNIGYKFTTWNDGSTEAKRTIVLTQDTALIAEFDSLFYTISTAANNPEWGIVTGAGTYQDGKTITLTATPNEYYKFISWNDGNIDNPRSITVIGDMEYTAIFESEIRVIDILLSQAKIELSKGNSRKLEASVLPFNAFNKNVIWTCSDETIAVVSDGWVVARENGTAMVRATSEDGGFYKECHVSVGDEYDKVQVTPSSNSAGFVWSMVEDANKYILIIWLDAEQTQKFITMTFNSQGHLTNMEIHPQNAPRKTPSQVNSGFNFTVTGLKENTTYSFVMDSYNLQEEVIDSQVGQFTTTTTDLENTFTKSVRVQKVFENGTIYILREGEKYTIDGRKVE